MSQNRTLSSAPNSIVFVAAKRTPFGSFGGALKNWTPTELAVHAAKAALTSAGIPPAAIDHVIVGNVQQTSSDASYLARHVGLKSGVPIGTPAVTVNRLCGSGFEAIIQGARLIQTGEATTVLVGGTESMSGAPYVLRNARFGYRLGTGELEDSLMAGLTDAHVGLPMAMTAENLAVKYGITRDESDAFSLRSQTRAASAITEGRFQDEIAPITLIEKGKERILDKDEHPRPDTKLESLQKLKPVFKKDGVVTAGSASGMVDGAAMLVITTRARAESEKWRILGEFVDSHTVGCDPTIMGIGPVGAIRGVMKKNQLELKDMNFIEINEAFACQVLAVDRELGISKGGLENKLNVDGGAISIGHPLGASGARLTMHALYRLGSNPGFALASACIGGGQGIALIVKG